MRGILFTEYLEFANSKASPEMVDMVLTSLEGAVSGAYTSVGNYSFEEFAKIHVALCKQLELEPSVLEEQFGYHLLGRFKAHFPDYFSGVASGLDFLEKVGAHIHEEVKKLYPDSSPPDIVLEAKGEASCRLVYRSHRPLAAVARGLTQACLEHFGDPYRIAGAEKDGDTTIFTLEHI